MKASEFFSALAAAATPMAVKDPTLDPELVFEDADGESRTVTGVHQEGDRIIFDLEPIAVPSE